MRLLMAMTPAVRVPSLSHIGQSASACTSLGASLPEAVCPGHDSTRYWAGQATGPDSVSQPALTTRFAPSPTGYLHRGHALSAVIGWHVGRTTAGRWHLRIEDIDAGRCRPAFVEAIHADLDWLGLRPDGPAVMQSDRAQVHRQALADLQRRGLVYPCRCTRADIERATLAPHAGETVAYPGTCRRNRPDTGEPGDGPHAWRLDLAATALPMTRHWHDIAAGPQAGRADVAGDPVLMRKDGAPAYHLAVVLDDAAAGVTLVTRGQDLLAATGLQALLQQLLGLPQPAYLHHPLLTDASGRRLAERDGAQALAVLRARGADGAALRDDLLRHSAPLFMAAGIPT